MQCPDWVLLALAGRKDENIALPERRYDEALPISRAAGTFRAYKRQCGAMKVPL